MKKQCAIIGTVGIPASYGGFETLVQNLVVQHAQADHNLDLVVYCSAKAYEVRPASFLKARLSYVPLKANGAQSILFDIWSMIRAVREKADVLLVLGVSGALFFPLLRMSSLVRLVVNVDGVEWKREKWRGLARAILRWSEWSAVRFAHVVIADNAGIAEHVRQRYGRDCDVIAYGGDHATESAAKPRPGLDLPKTYALALARIEPENNVAMILEAFADLPDQPLVFVGNWENSAFGREMREKYTGFPNLHLCDPVYDAENLRSIRDHAWLYVHGHAAGGTNPSLVEMMHFGIPIIAYDVSYNRYSTESQALYFASAESLRQSVRDLRPEDCRGVGTAMAEIARREYVWTRIVAKYFGLLNGEKTPQSVPELKRRMAGRHNLHSNS